jgi:hypothetical protein
VSIGFAFLAAGFSMPDLKLSPAMATLLMTSVKSVGTKIILLLSL